MHLTSLGGYLLLIALAILAPTPIPIPLDGIIVGLIAAGFNAKLVITIALIGDLIGTALIYVVGRHGGRFLEKASERRKHKSYKAAKKLYHRYGHYALLLSGVPFLGDSLIFISGVMQLPFLQFIVWLFLGKILWYAIVYGGIINPLFSNFKQFHHLRRPKIV